MNTLSTYLFLLLILSPLLLIRHLNRSKNLSEDAINAIWTKLYGFYAVSSFILVSSSDQFVGLGTLSHVGLALISGVGLLLWAWLVGVVVVVLLAALGFKLD